MVWYRVYTYVEAMLSVETMNSPYTCIHLQRQQKDGAKINTQLDAHIHSMQMKFFRKFKQVRLEEDQSLWDGYTVCVRVVHSHVVS